MDSSTSSVDQPEQEALSVSSEVSVEAPSVQKIIRFAIPAVGVWLCSPLLSLIDTSAVGLLSGTAQQAALNPAAAVTEYSALLLAFLYTATTNLVAANPKETKTELHCCVTTFGMCGGFSISNTFSAIAADSKSHDWK